MIPKNRKIVRINLYELCQYLSFATIPRPFYEKENTDDIMIMRNSSLSE